MSNTKKDTTTIETPFGTSAEVSLLDRRRASVRFLKAAPAVINRIPVAGYLGLEWRPQQGERAAGWYVDYRSTYLHREDRKPFASLQEQEPTDSQRRQLREWVEAEVGPRLDAQGAELILAEARNADHEADRLRREIEGKQQELAAKEAEAAALRAEAAGAGE